MTRGVWHSCQRWGLDKGAGIEALTGDGRRRGQNNDGVAVLSFSRWSGVARSTETKQSEMASGEVGKW
jgi:hypothetical protein